MNWPKGEMTNKDKTRWINIRISDITSVRKRQDYSLSI